MFGTTLRIGQVKTCACPQALEAKQLQKEAAQRLNVMIDELRNAANADLSAKNLGDEGTAYIAEGLAFNDRSLLMCFMPPASVLG